MQRAHHTKFYNLMMAIRLDDEGEFHDLLDPIVG